MYSLAKDVNARQKHLGDTFPFFFFLFFIFFPMIRTKVKDQVSAYMQYIAFGTHCMLSRSEE